MRSTVAAAARALARNASINPDISTCRKAHCDAPGVPLSILEGE
jgi:hypothetical protein